MPTVWGTNTAKVELVYSLLGINAVNVLWFERQIGGIALTNLETLADIMADVWWEDIRPELGSPTTLMEVRASQWEFPAGLTTTRSVGVSATRPGGVVPNNVALVTTFNTSLMGRSRQGRCFLYGLAEERVGHNTYPIAGAAEVVDAFDLMATTADLAGWSHVVSSAYTGGFERPTRLNTRVTGYRVDGRVDSQRRRLPRVFGN